MNQTFPWLGKPELQGNAAAEAARAEKSRYDAARLKLFYQVKEAYNALLPEAKQAFEVSLQGYQTGTGTFLNVVDA